MTTIVGITIHRFSVGTLYWKIAKFQFMNFIIVLFGTFLISKLALIKIELVRNVWRRGMNGYQCQVFL